MYVCMYVCMYAAMYVCSYVRMYVCMHVHMYVYMYAKQKHLGCKKVRGQHCKQAGVTKGLISAEAKKLL